MWCVCTDSCFCATEQTWSRVLIGPSCKRARSCPPQMMMWSPWKCFAIVQSSRKVPSIKTCGGLGNCPQMFSIPEFASNIYIQMMRNGGKLTNQSKGTVFSCFACFFFFYYFVTMVSKATNWCTGSLSLWSKNIKDVSLSSVELHYRYISLILYIPFLCGSREWGNRIFG